MCLVLLLSSLAILSYGKVSEQYPAYIWAQTAIGKKLEVKPTVGKDSSYSGTDSSKVSEEIKNILDKTNANSFIVYHRPGMTTENLVNGLVTNHKISNLLRESNPRAIERSFTDVQGMPLTDVVEKEFKGVKKFIIDSKESFANLIKDIENGPKVFIHQYYVVELPYEKDESFDDVVYQVERAFAARTLDNHISIITGSESTRRLLQDVDVEPVEEEANVKDDVPFVYLTSLILTKILIMLPIVFLMILAILQLFYIKTPLMFVEKGIDFGKIEK